MSWTCPHCDAELDEEKMKKFGARLAKKEVENYLTHDSVCNTCSKPIKIHYISHTSYKPCGIDKRAQLTLVGN